MKRITAAFLSIGLLFSMVFGTNPVFADNKAPEETPAMIDPAAVAISNSGGFVVADKGIKYMMPGGKYLTGSWLFIGSQTWCFDDEGYMIVGRRIVDSKLWNLTYEGMPLLLDPPMPVSVPVNTAAASAEDGKASEKSGAKAPAKDAQLPPAPAPGGVQAPSAPAPGGVQAPSASAPGGVQAPSIPAPQAAPTVPLSGNAVPGPVSANALNAVVSAAPAEGQTVSRNMPALPGTVKEGAAAAPETAPAATDNSQLLVQNYENKKMT